MNRDTWPGRRMLGGYGLLLLAIIMWSARNLVPAWAAKSVTTTVDLTTTTERDDERVKRAFAAAQRTGSFASGWEPLPNDMKLIRHSRVWVRAPSEAQAVAQATVMAGGMSEQFGQAGAGRLVTDVHRRAIPVLDDRTNFLRRALRAGALGTALLGLTLVVTGWRRFQTGFDRKPPIFWWGLATVQVVALLPVLLPAPLVMTLFIIGVPGLISGTIVYKTWQIRKARIWPSTRARITKSQVRVERRSHAAAAPTVENLPVVEYEYTLGPDAFHGSHVTGADNVGTSLQAQQTLARYPLGATVPVYYNPANPAEAVLERDTPWNPRMAYAAAAGIFMAGVAAAAAFLNLDALMNNLRAHFPNGAEPQGTIFFGLCGLWTLFVLWDDRRNAARAAGWPTVTGRVVSSSAVSHTTHIGGKGGNRVELFEPVVEYSYKANGREYHSTQVAFGAAIAGGQGPAEARAARYPPETDVLVYYDPADPSNAVLETKVAFGWPILVLAFAFLGLAVFFSAALR